MLRRRRPISTTALMLAACVCPSLSAQPSTPELEELVVWGEHREGARQRSNPSSLVTPENLRSVNIVTTEDLVKHEPSLVVRRRFIGDANGTLGLRGSNMFQTTRSMVFADGVPLHYFLQSRWNGAPRWTMVSASEIAQVDILYGPFSAEYSGNAMGGVVLIETAIPQQRELHFDSSYFVQDFSAYGFDDSLAGYKTFLSYGDKFDALSIYLSYNRLENDSQPQSFYYGAPLAAADTSVAGAIAGQDELGNQRLYFGDGGVIRSETDNYKIKLGYDLGQWSGLLNLALEDRHSQADAANSYVLDDAGNTLWSGEFEQGGQAFAIPASRLSVSESERRSRSLGLRLRRELNDSFELEANLNRFDILQDQSRSSRRNPADPLFDGSGQVSDYDDSGWRSAELKLIATDLLDGLALVSGLRHEHYRLNFAVYDSNNYARGQKDAYASLSGGETSLDALFTQLDWQLNQQWELALGLRWEHWRSEGGYYSDDQLATAEFDLRAVPDRQLNELSPKLSIAYSPADDWQLRYSLARAYRFPIVEELFSQFRDYNTISEASPQLDPERGLHHNLMLERQLSAGDWRLNLFQENIESVIESQSTTLPGGSSLRSFVPVDEVRTRGLEFIANLFDLLPATELRFNLAYTEAEIIKNDADPLIEGKIYPRMPKWRANLLATYHINDDWNLGGSLQYASDSYDRLDNRDRQANVYGAQDAYTRVNLKTNYQLSENSSVAFGVDNLFNKIDYVVHPWPGRSAYLSFSYDY